MPECPICRRTYDDRFKVFVPPYSEAFDTVECARFAAAAGAGKAQYTPVILPTIEALRPHGGSPAAAPRAGVLAGAIPAAQIALAGGVGLLAAGTAAAVYLGAQPPSKLRHATTIAAARPTPSTTADATSGPTGSGERRPPLTHQARLRNPAHQAPASIAAIAYSDARDGSRSGEKSVAQLASRVIPTASSPTSAASSTQLPSPEPAATRQSPRPRTDRAPRPTTHRSPRPTTHRPPKPAPSPSPTPAPEPAAPSSPTAVAAPASPAASGSTEQAHQTRPKPQPSPGGNPPPATPPPTTPPPTTPTTPSPSTQPEPTTSTSETRPGNGYGDRNHEHTGPPGQSGGDSGSSTTTGSGGSGSHGNGHGNDNDGGSGNGNGNGHGNGNGGGHGHGG